MDIAEELEVLSSIWCHEDDGFDVILPGWKNGTETVFAVNIETKDENDMTGRCSRVRCIFTLNADYPQVLPNIVLQSDGIKSEKLQTLKEDILEFSKSLVGTSLLLEIFIWIKEHLQNYVDISSLQLPKKDYAEIAKGHLLQRDNATFFLHLDHMRAKTKYLKTINVWVTELGIYGAVIFEKQNIFIILQGKAVNLKEYLIRMKTFCIDVDSKGRSCKERMLTVLKQEETDEEQIINKEFLIQECDNSKETEEFMKKMNVGHLCHLIKRP